MAMLAIINGRLILQPGTQIYLNDIDMLYFYERNNCICIHYERQNKSYDKVLASAERFHLDSFSACLLSDDESDRSEE